MSKKYVIGIDLGGTKILTAVADLNKKILAEVKVDTEALKGPGHVIGNIVRSAVLAMERSNIKLKDIVKIGVGAPGPIIFKKGIIVSPPNLPGWNKLNLKARLESIFRKPVVVDNDANLAALAESKRGAGKGKQNMIYMTVSTGIGGGIILNGKLFRGSIGGAGEIGHTIIQKEGAPKCGCGNIGCLEVMGSGTAITNMAKRSAKKGSLILKLAGNNRAKIDAVVVSDAARKGDPLAKSIINEAGENIGIGIANMVNIINPEMVVIGGGISNMGDLIFSPIRKSFKKHVLEVPGKGVRIVKAKLGTKVGLVGAILSCFD